MLHLSLAVIGLPESTLVSLLLLRTITRSASCRDQAVRGQVQETHPALVYPTIATSGVPERLRLMRCTSLVLDTCTQTKSASKSNCFCAETRQACWSLFAVLTAYQQAAAAAALEGEQAPAPAGA